MFTVIFLVLIPLFNVIWSYSASRIGPADLTVRDEYVDFPVSIRTTPRIFFECFSWVFWVYFFVTEVLGLRLLEDAGSVLSGEYLVVYQLFDWSTMFNTDADFVFRFDSTTTLMCFIVFTVWMCVEHFVPFYMGNDRSLTRFFIYLPLFTFCMLVMVTSDNMIQFFMGWEAIGLCSYLLINFWYTRVQANKAALKAILVNRIGDFFLLSGIAYTWIIFETFSIDDIILAAMLIEPTLVYTVLGLEITNVDLLCLCFFVAAMSKSAQFGLHTWLPDAMEGPTPVSALIHAATMVTAGIYLLVRLSGVFVLSFLTMAIMSVIGALTAFFAATTALAQNDIKKIIAFSTCSQLGYMVMACGAAHFSLAFFHLLTHAFFKALLFLCAGVVIHALGGEQDLRRMGGLRRYLPFVHVAMTLASAALAGIPYLSGYYSKDAIIGVVWFQSDWLGYFCGILAIVAAFCTSMYSAAVLQCTFLSSPRWSLKTMYALAQHNPSDLTSHIPLFVLSFLSIFTGYFLRDLLIAQDLDVVVGTFSGFSHIENLLVYFEFTEDWFKNTTMTAAIFGWVLYYVHRHPGKFYIYSPTLEYIGSYKFLYYRWCFDMLYSYYIVGVLVRFINNSIYMLLQQKFVDKWFLEVFISQTEQGSRLIAEGYGVDSRTYLRYFMLGLVVFTVLFYLLVVPVDMVQEYTAYELGRKL